jgi:hypothetical protein
MEAAYCKSKMKGDQFQPRNPFSKAVKQATLKKQKGRCAKCGEYAINMQYHHKHGRDDNSPEYCEALCLDCHKAEHSECIIGYIPA